MPDLSPLPDHYSVEVLSALPSFEVLHALFSEVHRFFRPEYTWRMDDQLSDTIALLQRTFFLKGFERSVKLREVCVWAKEHGYRPASHLEAISFGIAQPKAVHQAPLFNRRSWVIALGSTTLDVVYPHVTVLHSIDLDTLQLEVIESLENLPYFQEARYLLVQLA